MEYRLFTIYEVKESKGMPTHLAALLISPRKVDWFLTELAIFECIIGQSKVPITNN